MLYNNKRADNVQFIVEKMTHTCCKLVATQIETCLVRKDNNVLKGPEYRSGIYNFMPSNYIRFV